jgi:disulfide bond formation protein DsbB
MGKRALNIFLSYSPRAGLFINFFDVSTVGWTLNIAWSLYLVVVLQLRTPSPPVTHAVVWGSAAFLSLMPLTTESYGQSGPWCWISGDKDVDQMWRFLSFYIPLWLAVGVNAYLYYAISNTLKRYAVLSKVIP